MWTLAIAIGGVGLYVWWEFVGKRRGLPPGPTPLPLIGTIHQVIIPGDSPQNRIQRLTEKYGSIMTLWIGTSPAVFITDYRLLKELFTGKTADVLSSRPFNYNIEHFTDGCKGIIANKGASWKEQRRFSLSVLRNFGFGRNIMESKISLEIDILLESIQKMAKSSVNSTISLADPLQTCIGSIITNIIIGHRFDQDDPSFRILREKLEENFKLVIHPGSQMISQLPPLRFLPGFSSLWKQMEHNRLSFYAFVKAEVEEHKKDFDPLHEPEDYTHAYLKEIHDRKAKGEDMGFFSEDQLIFALIDLWAAGMETTVTTLKWAFLYLVNYPDVQERVRREIKDFYADSDRAVSMDDRSSLPFVAATLNEVQRLANIVPINLFHENTQDIQVGEYVIPKGTIIVPQVSNVHLDPEFFPKPEEFRPERFLEGGALKKSDALLPFSIGKRVCVGESLARMELFMIFVAVLRKFRFRVEEKLSEIPVLGITSTPQPFEVIVEED